MTKWRSIVLGALVSFVVIQTASAQSAASRERGNRIRRPVFNPFATFSLSRFRYNALGYVEVVPAAARIQQTAPSTSASNESSASEPDDDASGLAPAAAAIRPPYRPPVRSPYRPPPRPPF